MIKECTARPFRADGQGDAIDLMSERRNARRYDLSLPIIVRIPQKRGRKPEWEDRGYIDARLYFCDRPGFAGGFRSGHYFDLAGGGSTHSNDVFVRAMGKGP